MLTKSGLSRILLIKIKNRKMRLIIPIAFTAIDELIEAFADWIWLFERLFPALNKRIIHSIFMQKFSLGLAFALFQQLFYELRKHRRWKMVEINTKDVYVTVELF